MVVSRRTADDWDWLEYVFGCQQDSTSFQDVGDLVCREGRLITFPNILQHRVEPFGLADRSRPGHRKVHALFLVDPKIKIISTAVVPPQQLDWWRKEIESSNVLRGLPAEIRDQIFDEIDDFPISTMDAKKIRLELSKERETYMKMMQKTLDDNAFYRYEH